MSAKYVQFPLFLLKGFFANPFNTADDILSFGIYHYSKRITCTPSQAAIYILEHLQQLQLGYKIDEYLLNCGSQVLDRFHGYADNYIPLDITSHEVGVILGLFETDDEFANNALEYARVGKAQDELGITGKVERTINDGMRITALIQEKEPMPMLKTDLIFAFRKNNKTEFEIAQLMAYIGIKSILGVKQYVKTNKQLVLARMFGYSKCLPKEEQLTPLQQKYAKRYHIDRVLEQLQLNWKVKIYSNHIRGFYVTTGSKMSMNELVLKAESTKRKTKLAALKNKKATALTAATQQLLHGITTA